MPADRFLVPLALTLIGLGCGLLGCVLVPAPSGCALVLGSLALDCLDGPVARRLDAVTALGAQVDYWSDVAIGYALIATLCALGRPLAAVGALGVMLASIVLTALGAARASGRTVATAILLIAIWTRAEIPRASLPAAAAATTQEQVR